MRTDRTAFPALTAAAVGICAMLAGCASGISAQAPAAGIRSSAQPAGSPRQGQVNRPPRASAGGSAAPAGGPSAQVAPAATRAPGSHPPSSRRKAGARPANGVYTDGPDGTPHYALSSASGPGGALRGSVSFLYQDGRISSAGSYAGTLSGRGKITLTLSGGRSLSGRYTAGRLLLAGCAAALPLATFAGGCTFTYHGHVP